MQNNNALTLWRRVVGSTYFFPLVLMVLAIGVNAALQGNFFELRSLSGNLRVFFPLMVLAAGQTIVVLAGGIDLSVGAIVSMTNAILVALMTEESDAQTVFVVILIALLAGVAAGVLNGLCVVYLRLQPIVTTYATGFIFSGLALLILPRPGGSIPTALKELYRSTPLGIPFVAFLIVLILIVWWFVRTTRFAQYLLSTGSKAEAAYASGVPANRVRLASYIISGLVAALAGLALTMSVSSGNARIGEKMTLDSVVAIVLGGTRLSGGRGGIFGTLLGVVTLGIVRNIISFAGFASWDQTLVNAAIIVIALAGPGLFRLIKSGLRSLNIMPRLNRAVEAG